jgi:hypothetical protein
MTQRATINRKIGGGGGAALLIGEALPPRSAGTRLLSLVRPLPRYQTNFHDFLTELCYTVDESRAGEVRKFPDWPLFHDLCDDLVREPLLCLTKSRRCLATWTATAFSIWLMAGGQDPRWPALMRSRNNRLVILASRKLEDIGGSAYFLRDRVRWMVEDLEQERNIREHWPGFPEFSWTFSEGRASNGSRISAVPMGKDQCRGPGSTLVWMEEVAMWGEAQGSIESAKMTTQGGGHCLLITTPQVGSYAADLVMDRIGKNQGWR